MQTADITGRKATGRPLEEKEERSRLFFRQVWDGSKVKETSQRGGGF